MPEGELPLTVNKCANNCACVNDKHRIQGVILRIMGVRKDMFQIYQDPDQDKDLTQE